MAKCKVCGKDYADGSQFCSHCGARTVDDSAVVAEALKSAQKDFDRDSMATLDKSRITYVCSVCGSINRIDQAKCTRCGKPRPRNEYVNALKNINQSKNMNTEPGETLVAPLPVQTAPEVQEPVAEPVVAVAPVQETAPVQEPAPVQEVAPVQEPAPVQEVAPAQPVAQPVQQTTVPGVVNGGGQTAPIAQPFIVVPYVDSMYPLRQYNPNQLYRYQPYTPEELAAFKAQREAEELQVRLAEGLVPVEDNSEVERKQARAKKIKSFGIGTLIIAIAILASAVVGLVTTFMADGFNFEALLSSGEHVLLPFVGSVVAVIVGIVAIIHSSLRISGKSDCRGWIVGLIVWLALVVCVAVPVLSDKLPENFKDQLISGDLLVRFFKQYATLLISGVLSFVYIIVSACSPKAEKAKKEDK